MRKATKRSLLASLVVAGLLMVPLMIAAPGATATPRAVAASSQDKFEGKITSVNGSKHTFKMNDHHRGIVKIKANNSTRYEHLSGFGALHRPQGRCEGPQEERQVGRGQDRSVLVLALSSPAT